MITLEIVTLKPSDLLVVTVQRILSDSDVLNLESRYMNVFGCKVLVLHGGITAQIVRHEGYENI